MKNGIEEGRETTRLESLEQGCTFIFDDSYYMIIEYIGVMGINKIIHITNLVSGATRTLDSKSIVYPKKLKFVEDND